jgi:hypothetical protein
MNAIDYVRAGLALVPIPRGQKKPTGAAALGWQTREKCITTEDAAGKYFGFEPGRCYRIRFVKDSKSTLYVDGRVVAQAPSKPQAAELANKIVLVSYTSGEVDELRVSGILDEDWLKKR